MIEIFSIVISAISSIIVAIVGANVARHAANSQKTLEARQKESKLSMDMMYAACKLSKGSALAIKKIPNVHCNGEMDCGLKAVDDAIEKYDEFMKVTTAQAIAKL